MVLTYKQGVREVLRREGNLCAECPPFSLRNEGNLCAECLSFSLSNVKDLLRTLGEETSLPGVYSRFTVGLVVYDSLWRV